MNEYLLYPGILLIVFLTDRLIVSRVIIREAKKWILFFASVICIFGTLLLDGYWSHLAGFTMGAVFISAYFIIRNNEYLKQEMTMMNWMNMGLYDGEYRRLVSRDVRNRAFTGFFEELKDDYYKNVFLGSRPSVEKIMGELLVSNQAVSEEKHKDPLTVSVEDYEKLTKVIVESRKNLVYEQINSGWYQRRFLHLYKKVLKEDFVRFDSVAEIQDLCRKSRRFISLPSKRWKAEDRLYEILTTDLTFYKDSLVKDYVRRYKARIREYAEKFSNEDVAGAAEAYYARMKSKLEKGEAFFCVILDDEIRIGGEVSKLADFGFNVTCNHFRNAGLIYKMLLRMNYMYREEHGSRDWPYYIVPADHIEKEEYHSIVLKCTVEPDRFHALSGPDMPVDL